MNPTIAAALIAGGISVASFAFNAWTTNRTLHAARAASLRDRQANVYQQILAFASHRTETRRNTIRLETYDRKTEARIKDFLASYTPPNTFELEASVLAFCPDSVVDAFMAAKDAEAEVWSAIAARASADELNEADPDGMDDLGDEAEARIEEADQADDELKAAVRDKMPGTRPADNNRSLIGKVIFNARSQKSLR